MLKEPLARAVLFEALREDRALSELEHPTQRRRLPVDRRRGRRRQAAAPLIVPNRFRRDRRGRPPAEDRSEVGHATARGIERPQTPDGIVIEIPGRQGVEGEVGRTRTPPPLTQPFGQELLGHVALRGPGAFAILPTLPAIRNVIDVTPSIDPSRACHPGVPPY